MHIRLYGRCGTDFGRSIAEETDNIHAMGMVEPVYERSTFRLTAKTVYSKGHTFKNLKIILLIETGDQQPTTLMKIYYSII